MRKLSFIKIAAVAALVFTSCEKDNLESPETIGTQEIAQARAPLSAKFNVGGSKITLTGNLPQNIIELRNEGISVSGGLADYVRNNLETLLRAAALSITNPDNLREFGFFESEIVELKLINSQYNDLVTLLNLDFNSFTTVPKTLAEARAAGIPISTGIEVLGDLQTILTRSLVQTGFNDPLRSLSNGEIIEVRRLRRVFAAIQEAIANGDSPSDPDVDPDPDPTPDPDPSPSADLSEATIAFIARFNIPQDIVDIISTRNAPFVGGAEGAFEGMRQLETSTINYASTATFLGNGVYRVETSNSQGTQVFFVERTLDDIRSGIRSNVFSRTGLSGGDRTPELDAVIDRIADAYTQAFVDAV